MPPTVVDLSSLIVKHPFTSTSAFGFIQTFDEEANGFTFRFLWRTAIVVTKLDADGSPTYEQVESVCFTNFALVAQEEKCFIRIENPGRNIKDLLNAIESFVGIGFTAKPITFDQSKPTTIFKTADVSKLVSLKIVGAVLADDLVARMEFVSKHGMSIEKMQILNSLQYKIDFAAFEIIFNGVRGQIAISANGTIKISGQLAPKLLNLIEQDLPFIK